MKQVEVQILKNTYLLRCADGQEDRLLQAVQQVDGAMGRIYEEGKMRGPTDRIAVLAALHLALDLLDVQQQLRALEGLQEAVQEDKAAAAEQPPAADVDAGAEIAVGEAAESVQADASAETPAVDEATAPVEPAVETEVAAQEAAEVPAADTGTVVEQPKPAEDPLRALIARIDQALQKIA